MKSFIAIFVLIAAVLPCRAWAFAGEATASDPVRGNTAHPSQPGGWAPPSDGAEGGTPLGGSTSPATEPVSRAVSAEAFRPSKLIAPGVLFTAGAIGVSWDYYINNINIPIKNYADGLRAEWGYTKAENWIQYAPLAAYVGLGACGLGEHSFLEHFFVAGTAWAAEGVLVNALKYTICEMRPNGSKRNSFPSGHTATAFLGAELVRLEYGGWAGAGAYTVATLTAAMRVYNNWHWFNDLLGGAAIGVVSANIGYWLLPLERRLLKDWFGWSIAPFAASLSSSSPAFPVPHSVLPSPSHPSMAYGLSVVRAF